MYKKALIKENTQLLESVQRIAPTKPTRDIKYLKAEHNYKFKKMCLKIPLKKT